MKIIFKFNIHFEKLRIFNIYGFYRLSDAVTVLDATFKSRKHVVKFSFWESEVHHFKGLKKCYLKRKKVYDPIIRSEILLETSLQRLRVLYLKLCSRHAREAP